MQTKVERNKLIVKLKDVDKKTYREISDHLGISEIRANTIYHREKRKLAE